MIYTFEYFGDYFLVVQTNSSPTTSSENRLKGARRKAQQFLKLNGIYGVSLFSTFSGEVNYNLYLFRVIDPFRQMRLI